MTLPPTIDEKVSMLAQVSDEMLPLFSPIERAVIIALKKITEGKKIPADNGQKENRIYTGKQAAKKGIPKRNLHKADSPIRAGGI